MSEDLEDFFLNTKPVRALVVANSPMTEDYAGAIAKKIDSTYAHTIKILDKLETSGLVQKEQQGRKKFVRTTEHGKRVARFAQGLRAELKDQSVQDDFHEAVFQAEEWNIVEGEDGLQIDCLGTETASVSIEELEKAVEHLQETTSPLQ